MKPRSYVAVVVVAICLAFSAQRSFAAGVVGDGTPASCTDGALDTALAGGGKVTFNCGADPHTIIVTRKTISIATTIDGGGLITISGDDMVNILLSVNSGVTFTVENLTIADGRTNSPGGAGGGILNDGGRLIVTNSAFGNNAANQGGAIANLHRGSMAITNTTFRGNTAALGLGGGAISNFGGTGTIINCTFMSNSADGASGGAIYNGGESLKVANSTFTANRAIDSGDGGAIFNGSGLLTVTNSTFTGNGAIENGGGGGIFNDSVATITGSTFAGNSATQGGGVYNSRMASITNSTFTVNSAPSNAACDTNPCRGGGLANTGGKVTITNTTFTDNRAPSEAGGNLSNGGLNGMVSVANAIVATGDCDGSITDGGHNIEDGPSCGFSAAHGSFNNTNPQLDPAGLKDNGGPTQTIALEAASPAINAGDESICAAGPVMNLDQRGYVRPGTGSANCSIGAFEFNSSGPAPPSPTNTSSVTPTPTTTAAVTPTGTPILPPSATQTPLAPSPTPPPTPSPPAVCAGDCSGTGEVTVDELITLVNIALGNAPASSCPHGIPSGTPVDVVLITQAVNNALTGCPPP